LLMACTIFSVTFSNTSGGENYMALGK
jgi:hypothetical protein